MNRIKQLASSSPITSGIAVTLAFIVMLILSAVLANRWPPESQSWYIANTVGRLILMVILLAVLFRLGWLRPAGLTRPGQWQAWLIMLLALVYVMGVSTYAMTGRLDLSFSEQALPGAAALFILVHALFEEVVFRGLILVALVNVWGGTTRGLVKSIVVSSLFFAGMHVINVIGGNPLPVVLLQSVGAFFLGILFGGLVLSGRSIYPAVLLHGIANLIGNLNLGVNPAAGSSPSAWMVQSALIIPLAVLGLYILRSSRQGSVVPVVA